MEIKAGDIVHCPGGGIMVKAILSNETFFGYEYPFICCELPFILNVKDITEKDGKLTAPNRGKTTMHPYDDQKEWMEQCKLKDELEKIDKRKKKMIKRLEEVDLMMKGKREGRPQKITI